MSLLLHGARLFDDGAITDDAWILVADGRIAELGVGTSWQQLPPVVSGQAEVLDATARAGAGALLTPGFIDLHGHGGGGAAYDDGAEAIRAARALHRAHGTTRAVISLVTAPIEQLARRLELVAELCVSDPDVLGSHLEGPFLAQSQRGAHDSELLCAPTSAALDRLLAAGNGTVRQVTIAPELPGGLDAVRQVVAAGSVAAVGHTGADLAQAAAAFDAGASILTHTFNAMSGLHHRWPGPVGAALSDERVTLEVIADGVHLHPAVVRMLCAAAPGRIALVTDAMAAAGAPDGSYLLGALAVTVVDGVARLSRTDGDGLGAIAGSTLTQDQALRTAVAAGVPLPTAIDALTRAPADAIARPDLGRLAPGSIADIVLLDSELAVRRVWVAGQEV